MKVIYIKHRLPSAKIDHKTPFEIVHRSKPSVKHIHDRVHGPSISRVRVPKQWRVGRPSMDAAASTVFNYSSQYNVKAEASSTFLWET